MARARGIRSTLSLKFETTYGTAATGNFASLPFSASGLKGEQGLIEDDLLGQGRDPADPVYDVLRIIDKPITVPLDVRNIGYWLYMLCGAPGTTGTDPYTHTFTSGLLTGLPSATIEIGYPDIPIYFLYTGVKVNTFRTTLQRSGLASAEITLSAQDEGKNATTQAGTPTSKTITRFAQAQGNIQRNDSDLGSLTSVNMEYSNNLESLEDIIRADDLIEGFDETVARLSGDVAGRFAATTLWDDADTQTAIDLGMIYTIDASNKLTLNAHRSWLERNAPDVNGPGGVQFSANFTGSKDSSEGEMFEAILINDVDDYAFA